MSLPDLSKLDFSNPSIPKKLTIDAFNEQYKPQKNHLNSNASWDGCMYETYGQEMDYVRQVSITQPGRVWTVLDCDGQTVVDSGFHYVNRMGYIITEVAVQDDECLLVSDDDQVYA